MSNDAHIDHLTKRLLERAATHIPTGLEQDEHDRGMKLALLLIARELGLPLSATKDWQPDELAQHIATEYTEKVKDFFAQEFFHAPDYSHF